MITVITGTPGAGKTLYAISKLLLPMVGYKFSSAGVLLAVWHWLLQLLRLRPRKLSTDRLDPSKVYVPVTDENGVTTMHPRTIYTNIKGLLVEHELVELGSAWSPVKEGNEIAWRQVDGANPLGLHNWHEWAKPGAIIVIDEFQRLWPPRPNGAPVPPDISGLDTHRHMGVDFVLITQNAMNVDRHIHGLTGRHLHVRRVGNMRAAMVYEWDHCSKSLMYSKAMDKRPWRFDKRVFQLYHSADAHTKQPRRLPGLVYVVIAAVAIGAWKIPESWSRIAGKQEEQQARMKGFLASQAHQAASAASAPRQDAPGGLPGAVAPVAASARPRVMGCAMVKAACRCYEDGGGVLEMPDEICRAKFDAPADLVVNWPHQAEAKLPAISLPPGAAAIPASGNQVVKVLNAEEPLGSIASPAAAARH